MSSVVRLMRVSMLARVMSLAFAVGCVVNVHAQPPAAPAQPSTPPTAPSTAAQAIEYVKLTTSMGEIVLELDRENAPISVENFLNYMNKGHYEGTVFHRVMDGFMIQGGGFTADLKQKATDKPIKNEWQNGLKNKTGTVAMARRPAADSATSQFYINVSDNDMLDTPRDGAAYAVFGKVIAGMDVVNKIKAVPTGVQKGMENVPKTPIVIEKVVKITKEEATVAPKPDATPAKPGK